MCDYRHDLSGRRLKRMDDMVVAITQWEDKLKAVDTYCGMMLDISKIVASVKMLPPEVTDMVFITMKRVDQEHQPLKNKHIFGCVSDKASACGPVPMNIGAVACRWHDGEFWGDGSWDEVEIAMLYPTCGGLGHFSRECLSRARSESPRFGGLCRGGRARRGRVGLGRRERRGPEIVAVRRWGRPQSASQAGRRAASETAGRRAASEAEASTRSRTSTRRRANGKDAGESRCRSRSSRVWVICRAGAANLWQRKAGGGHLGKLSSNFWSDGICLGAKGRGRGVPPDC